MANTSPEESQRTEPESPDQPADTEPANMNDPPETQENAGANRDGQEPEQAMRYPSRMRQQPKWYM